MFAGLVLTSISTVMLRAALFQRKSRSGWLEELDEIREDALEQHDGGVANVVDADDIWTDLRDGGEYEDPHEIASLYATDETPDRPVAKPEPRAKGKARSKASSSARRPREVAPSSEVAAEPAPSVEPVVADAPAASPDVPVEAPVIGDEPSVGASEVAASEVAAPAASQYDDQIWVQPAPHPIRPSEMWHPAELAPMPLGEESYERVAEERVASADLMDPTYHPRHEPTVDVVEADEQTAAALEADLVARADAEVAAPAGSAGNLVAGPVGRRVRRDRPADRPKAPLPPPEAHLPLADRGDRSPLPSPALPPAALPTRSNRLPDLDLPATPSSVVAPRTVPAVTGAAPAEPTPPTEAPSPAEPAADTAPVEVPAGRSVVAAPVAAEAPAAVPATSEAAPIAIGEDGLVTAPGTIVRIGGERQARAVGGPDGVVVALERGWCWASPGDGGAAPLRIDLPAGSLTVDAGATALAVAEADGSVFVVVAAGSAHLERGGDGASVERGTIVMIDPSGAAQMDAATDIEIEADPVVAENLALDAEL